jgi:hypothetical protein
MSVSKPQALISPPVFRCSSPSISLKTRKKIRVGIFLCKVWRYLNNTSAYRNTRASAEAWKRPENRKATTVGACWSRVNSIKFEGHMTLWRFLVALCNTKGSRFWPQIVFPYFIRVSSKAATISLYCIEWLFFKTDTECTYCTLRNKYLNIIKVNFRL